MLFKNACSHPIDQIDATISTFHITYLFVYYDKSLKIPSKYLKLFGILKTASLKELVLKNLPAGIKKESPLMVKWPPLHLFLHFALYQ